MDDLKAAAEAINAQLQLTNNLAWAVDSAAHQGQVVSDGTIEAGAISGQLVTDYNTAYQTVLDTAYLTAADVLNNAANTAIDDMHTAINDLVSATAVLATVATVAEMATDANTTQEQLQVQQALATTDMTIEQADVDNFNAAAAAVQDYAQAAAAFTSAAQDSNITGAIDNYAAANNVAVASYTAVSYTQNVDKFLIEFGTSAYLEFNGSFADSTLTTTDIWGNVGYTGG